MHNLEETMKNRNLILTAILAAVMLTACGPAAAAPAPTEAPTEAAATEVTEIMEPPVTEETEEPTEESAPTVAPVTTEKATEETKDPATEATTEVEEPATEETAEPATEETQPTEAPVIEETTANIPATLSAADYQSYSGGNLTALEAALGTNHTWEVTKGCLVDGGDMGLAVWTAADGTAITAQCEMNAGSTDWIVKFVF